MFGKKQSKRIPIRKMWDYTKKKFAPSKEKVYPISREERKNIRKFIEKQTRKWYIWPLKSPQTVPRRIERR